LRSLLSGLDASVDDEDSDGWLQLQALKATLYLLYLWVSASIVVALAGIVGIVQARANLVRAFSMHSFLDLIVTVLSVAVLTILGVSTSRAASHEAVTVTICEALQSRYSSLLGWGLEACEERWHALSLGVFLAVACLCLARAWCCLRLLQHYTVLMRATVRPHREISTPEEHQMLSPRRTSPKQRIFLIPHTAPSISITPSSPANAEFPPTPSTSSAAAAEPSLKMTVYAPIEMTSEQARHYQAQEMYIDSRRSRRTREPSERPRRDSEASSSTEVPSSPSHPAELSKGKRA